MRLVATGGQLTGVKSHVVDGAIADLLIVVAREADDWCLSFYAVDASAAGLSRRSLQTLDPTRKLARIEFDSVPGRLIGTAGKAAPALERTLQLAAVALANEMVGGAARLLESAVEYAKERVQFGRAIGSFQAVKHRCADLLLEVELAKSAAYQAASAPASELQALASLAKAVASDAYVRAAKDCVQLHGGIGFTWDHDAHLWYKRAKSSEVFLGDPAYHRERVAHLWKVPPPAEPRQAAEGRKPASDSVEAERVRHEVRTWLDAHWNPGKGLVEWRNELADSGWGMPTWPKEWFGRDLPQALQPVVDEEFARAQAVGVARTGIRLLAAATLLEHGDEAQKSRYLRRILTGEDTWCQLFSEPGSGSDLAGATSRADFDGEQWIVNGQKVWTTSAHHADYGLLLARTDWEVPKHQGLTYFILDMRQPGVEVRPLRQMNGHASFNQVFFSDAVVPAENRVSAIGNGWQVAITTLAHERRGADGVRGHAHSRTLPGRIYREERAETEIALEPYKWYPQRAGRVDLVVERATSSPGASKTRWCGRRWPSCSAWRVAPSGPRAAQGQPRNEAARKGRKALWASWPRATSPAKPATFTR